MRERAAAIAAWGVPSAHRFPAEALDDPTFDDLLGQCERERVLGLLGSAVRDGAIPASDPQRAALETRWLSWLHHSVRVERLASEVVETLERDRVTALVLKGLALAHTSYPDPSARLFGDVDLLVEPGRLHRAAECLRTALDGLRAEPELRPGYDDRFGREILLRIASIEVDLHRTFVNGVFGWRVDLPAMFANAEPIEVGGRPLRVLGVVDRLLHAAYASTLSDWPPRLVSYRDLVQVITRDAPPPDAVVERAAAWRAEAVLATAVTDAWRTLRCTGRPPLLEWAERYRASRRDRLLLAASRGPTRGYTSQLTSVFAIPGVSGRVSFLRALAFPSREYREARRLGRFGLLGAGATRARRT